MQLPYFIVAMVLIVLAIVIARYKLPDLDAKARRLDRQRRAQALHSLWKHRNLIWGIPAIFIYLIAEIGVSNLFINFVSAGRRSAISPTRQASNYLFLLWGGMMVGRFAGSQLMRSYPAEKDPGRGASIGAFVVMIVTVFATGKLAMWSLIQRRPVPLHHVPDDFHARHLGAWERWTEEGLGPAGSWRSPAARWWSCRASWPTRSACSGRSY